ETVPRYRGLGEQTTGQFDCILAHFIAFVKAWTGWHNPQVNPDFSADPAVTLGLFVRGDALGPRSGNGWG
ncbi:hypothetical protein, partial [Mycobacterium sp. E3251]|uniref:hypothetical protein n=1 Tax=Mycobacterium sp. E3251 TaxID=1834144 RepID=UPI001E4FAB05